MSGKVFVIAAGAVLTCVIGALLFLFGDQAADNAARRHILVHGVAAPAEVLSVTDTGNRHNRNPEVEMGLRVEPKEGAPYDTKVRLFLSAVDLPRFQPGTKLTVKYDSENRAAVIIVGQ